MKEVETSRFWPGFLVGLLTGGTAGVIYTGIMVAPLAVAKAWGYLWYLQYCLQIK